MFRKATPLFLICETPLHAGSGSDLGIIDLPIQRERHTSFPKIEASSLKGSLREAFENKLTAVTDRQKIHLAFGFDDKTPETDENKKAIEDLFKDDKQFQGALAFTDARLLLFPVKSMKGVFAWITCEKVLTQFKRDFDLTDTKYAEPLPTESTVPKDCELLVKDNKIVLEEYTFSVTKDSDDKGYTTKLAKWLADKIFDSGSYWHSHLSKNLVVLPDDDFADFVNLSTEVITRTKINNETGTVAPGALFTEEYLPAESVMYSLVLFSPIFHNDTVKSVFINGQSKQDQDTQSDFETKAVESFFRTKLPQIVQIGGNATLGKGLVRTKVISNNK
jgi:CRISPR-associated protein Cmr4